MDAKDDILRDELADLQARYQKQRQQLGGVNAANNRKSQRIRELQARVDELEAENDKLKEVNGDMCARVNRAEDMARGLHADLKGVAPDLARVWERAHPELGGGK